MAAYIFENMSSTQIAGITSEDVVAFSNPAITARNVVVTSVGNDLSITAGTTTKVFPALPFAATGAPTSVVEHFAFADQSVLLIGSDGNDSGAALGTVKDDVVHGFAGNDSINSGDGHDYVYGGAGADRLRGENGNDHLYGNALSAAQGAADGNDDIDGGDGSDYIQGNAGNDTLAGGLGDDRVQGGQGNDLITGDDGNDALQGNMGNDTLSGAGDNDIVRGGQGDDSLSGGTGNDQLLGDLGNDTLSGGFGVDVLSGGGGNDIFLFGTGESPVVGNFIDTILDFTIGADKINLGSPSVPAIILETGTVADLSAARTSAQTLLNATVRDNNTEVVVSQIGSDTYLFYSSTAGTGDIDAVIKLAGLAASTITASDFIVG